MDTTGQLLRIAIQSKGRLYEDTTSLFKESGIKINRSERALLVRSNNFPVEVLYLRDDDIPETVASGVADLGVVGLNEVLEREEDVDTLLHLGVSKCHLAIAVPKHADYSGPQWLENKRIATSYPNILNRYLSRHNVKAQVHVITGSVEITPLIGLGDAIFDIVSSGSTLVTNNLKEVENVLLQRFTGFGQERKRNRLVGFVLRERNLSFSPVNIRELQTNHIARPDSGCRCEKDNRHISAAGFRCGINDGQDFPEFFVGDITLNGHFPVNGIGEDAFCIRRWNGLLLQKKMEMSEIKEDVVQGGALHFHCGLHDEAAHIFHADICERGMSFAAEKAQILPDHPVRIVDSVILVVGVMDESVQNTLEVRRQRFGRSFVMGDDAQLASQRVFFQAANRCGEILEGCSRCYALFILVSV